MTDQEDIAQQFCQGIRAATRAPADFPAFTFQPFDEVTLELLQSILPPLADYKPLPHPDAVVGDRPTRFALPLKEGAPVAQFWLDVAAALKRPSVQWAIADMLGIDPGVTPMFPAVALLRDLPGYRIRVHPDTKRKIATAQVYLAAHDRSPQIGVRFYRETSPESFTLTAPVPYLPGSGYFFRRQGNSWHGVNATTEGDGTRNSLMLVYFDSPKIGFN